MKNIDVYFLKKLETTQRVYQILNFDRITEIDTDSWTDDTRIKLLVKFVQNMGIPQQQGGYTMYPEDVLTSLTLIRDTEMNVFEINRLTSVLRLNGYDLILVERDDISEPKDETDYSLRELMISNIIYNSELVSAYLGRGNDLNSIASATSVNFLPFFNLTAEEMNMYQVSSTWNSYQVLKEKNQLAIINDTKMDEFLNSRGFTYIKLIPNS